jgi:hypothetical protein
MNHDENSGYKIKTPFTTNSKPRPVQVTTAAEIMEKLPILKERYFPMFPYLFIQETVKNNKVIIIIIIKKLLTIALF